ncbi:HAD family hydrolase [Enterococcus timonensis]|uniref:HAD family hydrolase n=1 Tax=Enterococcus timonensis TaxID=1852364 RepID=UPI0008DA4DCC|nr:HAD family hydrolase [Enterococcus timonensis]
MISAVVFDVDDTIYDQQAPFKEAVLKILPDFHLTDLHKLYLRFRYYSDLNFPKVITGELTLVEMRCHRIQASLADLNYDALSTEKALDFQKIYQEELTQIKMHAGVKKALDYLRDRQIPIGIITNGPTDHQFKKIKQLQLEQWVDTDKIIISQAAGLQKPEKEIFQLGEKLFGFDAKSTLYVGDNFDNDVLGAKSADWQALWFNHRRKKIKKGQLPVFDWEIQSFNALLPTLQEICE